MLNTAVAESLSLFYERLKDTPKNMMDEAVHELVKETIKNRISIVQSKNI